MRDGFLCHFCLHALLYPCTCDRYRRRGGGAARVFQRCFLRMNRVARLLFDVFTFVRQQARRQLSCIVLHVRRCMS